jgi:hypothetical protein
MTVKNLKDILEKFDDDAQLFIDNDSDVYEAVQLVTLRVREVGDDFTREVILA